MRDHLTYCDALADRDADAVLAEMGQRDHGIPRLDEDVVSRQRRPAARGPATLGERVPE